MPSPTGSGQFCDNASPAACTAVPPTAGLISPYNKLYDTPNKSNVLTARIDHKLFENNDLTVGFQLPARITGGRTARRPRLENAFQAKNINTDAVNFTDNHVFGASTVNQFRMQWSRYQPSFQAPDPLIPSCWSAIVIPS
ncbi:MAG: hypothetical protein IPP63_19365 [Chloracidobacterium sp.]|nr:hypothetical protein [Chloracidobacterium sp.]